VTASDLSKSGNQLLRALSPQDRLLISDHLRSSVSPGGTTVIEVNAEIRELYFPESGFIVIEEPVSQFCHVEIALVGYEGMLGWPALLGSRQSPHRAVVGGSGSTLHVIAADVLLSASRSSLTLAASLLNFVQALLAQMSRSIVCHVRSPLDQRIARWLLMRHDRIVGDQIVIRHDEIAAGLNAQRASVTNRLHVIEGERLISSRRGRIIILDRPGLEMFAGDAFGKVETNYPNQRNGFSHL
jgi:CRP-like cAMP-binding protein